MKTLYIECNMGAAGDMLMSALLELFPNRQSMLDKLNGLNIPRVKFVSETVVKCGISGTHTEVLIDGESESEHMHEHHHTSLSDIEHIISHLNMSEKVKKDVFAVYTIIAEAEGHAHNCKINEVHFHEVGTMDAVADIAGVCFLINELNADKIISSPVHTGSGSVKCAHGILPVPAPATEYILRQIPVYGGDIKGELCTPTGAALLKYFVSEFGDMPAMRVDKTGYGMGTKDFERANCVRIMIGETKEKTNEITELRCNVDDMTGEDMAFAVSRIFDAGAIDVFTMPAAMKKNRAGIMITCLCREDKKEQVLRAVFMHTSTIGIREYTVKRYVLNREEITVNTNYGEVRAKKSWGYGVSKIKPEHDDLEALALRNNISVSDIKFSE